MDESVEDIIKNAKTVLDFFDLPLEEPEIREGENKIDELYALCDDPMQTPVKLVDEQLRFTDLHNIEELFVENSGFLVVGVVGLQGSGKSTVLNILANRLSPDAKPFDGPFPTQSVENLIANCPETGGIDLYITQDRVILLDTQPLLSFALTNHFAQPGNAIKMAHVPNPNRSSPALAGPGNWSLDVWSELTSMQIVSFLFNVCHVVLVVSDNLTTSVSQLHGLIDRAAGLKPTVYTPSVLPGINKNLAVHNHHHPDSNHPNHLDQSHMNYVPDHHHGSVKPTMVTGRGAGGDENVDPNLAKSQRGVKPSDVIASGSDCVDNCDVAMDGQRDDDEGLNNSVRPLNLFEGQRQQNHSLETQSKDVTSALQRLKNLTDYSACLIHVYNQAPASVYLDPAAKEKLRWFHQRVLPVLYPEHRRLASLVSVGPRVLSKHLNSLHTDRHTNTTLSSAVAAAAAAAATTTTAIATTAITTTTAQSKVQTQNQHCSLPQNPDMSLARPDVEDPTQGSSVPLATTSANASVSSNHSDTANQAGVLPTQEVLSDPHYSQDPGFMLSPPSDKDSVHPTKSSELESQSCLKPEVDMVSENQEVPRQESFADVSSLPTKIKLTEKVVSDQNRNLQTSSANSTTKHDAPSEPEIVGEIVAECCTVLQAVQDELKTQLNGPQTNFQPAFPSESPPVTNLTQDLELDSDNNLTSQGLSGEKLNASILEMTYHVNSIRRDFFDLQRRYDKPRLFLLPEVDESGHTPLGCPTYGTSIRLLQEAVFSTPRQHMMPYLTEKKWIAYAQKMWDAVMSSPLYFTYHSILTNEI